MFRGNDEFLRLWDVRMFKKYVNSVGGETGLQREIRQGGIFEIKSPVILYLISKYTNRYIHYIILNYFCKYDIHYVFIDYIYK